MSNFVSVVSEVLWLVPVSKKKKKTQVVVSPTQCCVRHLVKCSAHHSGLFVARLWFATHLIHTQRYSYSVGCISFLYAYHAKSSTKPPSGSPSVPNVTYTAVTHPIPEPNPGDRTRQTFALAKEYLLPVYVRAPFVLDHGKGSWVWDCDGRKYLDFTAGVAVNALGHADDGVSEVGCNFSPLHVSKLIAFFVRLSYRC